MSCGDQVGRLIDHVCTIEMAESVEAWIPYAKSNPSDDWRGGQVLCGGNPLRRHP